MGRHRGPSCKLCRREKEKLFLKGEKCSSDKCAVLKRPYAPGVHGKLPSRLSEYGLRLREKQKARRIYGLNEGQFRNYFQRASKFRGVTGAKFLELLERRFDNVLFRLGFASSRAQARQLAQHGHFLISGKKVNVPSYLLKAGDTVVPALKQKEKFKALIEKENDRTLPVWLELKPEEVLGRIVSVPKREEIDTQIEENLIVEFYSR